mmetsp:Transcript_24533/g.35949  ORF Transcript_24533/g.35949 Transcript_24533/m.35949 type:complete len:218 (-) Transcript_24533:824-1477(-)
MTSTTSSPTLKRASPTLTSTNTCTCFPASCRFSCGLPSCSSAGLSTTPATLASRPLSTSSSTMKPPAPRTTTAASPWLLSWSSTSTATFLSTPNARAATAGKSSSSTATSLSTTKSRPRSSGGSLSSFCRGRVDTDTATRRKRTLNPPPKKSQSTTTVATRSSMRSWALPWCTPLASSRASTSLSNRPRPTRWTSSAKSFSCRRAKSSWTSDAAGAP